MTTDSLDCEVVVTRSGARAMLDRVTGEVMHPVVGPLVEAERLYLGPSRLRERLLEANAEPLRMLDVGLGAGSNAAAAWTLSAQLPATARRLEIVSFDRSLAALELAARAENAAAFALDTEAGEAARTLLAAGRCASARTSWRFVPGELPDTLATEPLASADLVFWDPFSPRANPLLWNVAAFSAVRRLCREGATLHTYSAATATRSALLLAGFCVGFGDSVGEKSATTMAALRLSELHAPLDVRWLARLGRSSAALPADAPEDAHARIAALAQFAR
jgi:queuine tRNA-ribosyltransferase